MDSQCGFRPGRSTSAALTEITENLTKCIKNKECALGTLVDLKKAFDTIDHKVLLKKTWRALVSEVLPWTG